VFTQAAEMRDYALGIELSGELRAKQRAVLAAEVAGKVLAVEKRVGDDCSKGKPIIHIDPASYEVGLQRQPRLSGGQKPPAEGRRAPSRCAAALDSVKARFDDASASLTRIEELHAKGYVTDEELSSARADADSAKGAFEREQQNLLRMRDGTRTESLAAQKARVDQAHASVKAAELALSRTSISPAFNCEVSALMCEAGQYVGPGTPLVEVVSAGAPEAWFNGRGALVVWPGGTVGYLRRLPRNLQRQHHLGLAAGRLNAPVSYG
jgi:HlyD family secretion protein